MTQPKTCEEFLTAARLLSEAAEVVGQESWAVNLLAEKKEKQLQALAAVMENQGGGGGIDTNTTTASIQTRVPCGRPGESPGGTGN